MAFTQAQSRHLKAKLDARNIKTRNVEGSSLPYIEGWHAIAEANRRANSKRAGEMAKRLPPGVSAMAPG